jgi:hypothetical protein
MDAEPLGDAMNGLGPTVCGDQLRDVCWAEPVVMLPGRPRTLGRSYRRSGVLLHSPHSHLKTLKVRIEEPKLHSCRGSRHRSHMSRDIVHSGLALIMSRVEGTGHCLVGGTPGSEQGRSSTPVQHLLALGTHPGHPLPGLRLGGGGAQSRCPHSNSRVVSDELRQRICTLRCELQAAGLDNGPVSIAARLQQEGLRPPAFSTIRRILTAAGLITPAPKKRPKSSYRRFQCRRGASLRCLPSASHAPRPLRTTTANGWTTGRKEVWQNWPGALELLLAAQAKEVAVAWLDDAASQLRFCAAS